MKTRSMKRQSNFPTSCGKRKNIDLLYDDSIPPLEIEYFKRPAEDYEIAENDPILFNVQIRCLTCEVLFMNVDLFKKHRPLDPRNPCCFKCNGCSKSFFTPDNYLRHIVDDHGTSKNYSKNSNHSSQSTAINKNLEEKQVIKTTKDEHNHSRKRPRIDKENNYVQLPKIQKINVRCDGCDVAFKDVDVLIRHTPSNSSKPCIFKCKICPDSFDESIGYMDHMLEHLIPFNSNKREQQILKLKCSICDKSFLQEYLLEEHLKVHKRNGFSRRN